MTWISGEIAVLIFSMNSTSSAYQNEIDSANTSMENSGLSKNLQYDVRSYFLKVMTPMSQQEELTEFFQSISGPLRV